MNFHTYSCFIIYLTEYIFLAALGDECESKKICFSTGSVGCVAFLLNSSHVFDFFYSTFNFILFMIYTVLDYISVSLKLSFNVICATKMLKQKKRFNDLIIKLWNNNFIMFIILELFYLLLLDWENNVKID